MPRTPRLHSLLLLAAILVAPTADAYAVEASALRIIGDEARTRVILDVDEEPIRSAFYLADPERLVVDLADTRFSAAMKKTAPRGLVERFRYGLIMAGQARLVVDLRGPAAISRSFFIPSVGQEPAKLVFDLEPIDAKAFAAKIKPPKPQAAPPPEPTREAVLSDKPIVVIDPGHGGIDSGAVGSNGLLEKDVTFAFSQKLRDTLRERGKVTPILTRAAGDFLSLRERVEFARVNGADLFISVHADAVGEDYVRGATVYTLSETASDALARSLAARENRADVMAGLSIEDQPVEVADILIDLARRETKNQATRFARTLVGDLKTAVRLSKRPRRSAAFQVLKAAEIPSVLLELGYLSNEKDELLMASRQWRTRAVDAVADAVERYFRLR